MSISPALALLGYPLSHRLRSRRLWSLLGLLLSLFFVDLVEFGRQLASFVVLFLESVLLLAISFLLSLFLLLDLLLAFLCLTPKLINEALLMLLVFFQGLLITI